MNRIVVEVLLERESDEDRFEHFANDVISAVENRVVLDTHATSDLGSDGRSVDQGEPIRVATSIRNDWRVKFRLDATRLSASVANGTRVFFVTNRDVVDKEFAKIKPELATLLGGTCEVEFMGASQLADVAIDKSEIFLRHYQADYEGFLAELNRPTPAGLNTTGDTEKLRLALTTIGAPDSRSIRTQLYERGVLLVVNELGSAPASLITKKFSELYRLSGQLPERLIAEVLVRLQERGWIEVGTGAKYHVTEAGQSAISAVRVNSITEERVGRNAIRSRIQESTGQELSDDHFERIWTVLEREITNYFAQRGQTFVGFILSLIDSEREHSLDDDESFIKTIARGVADTTPFRPLQEELFTATEDLFWERQSPAHEWLADLCVAYVMVCTLGFERDVRDQVVDALRKCVLVVDTDVVLTLLCEGESDSAALNDFFRRWRQLKGRTVVAEPVVWEAAYHAVIARRDYAEVEALLPGTEDDRQRLIDNAFVRAFAYRLADGAVRISQWEAYISQFAPRSGRHAAPRQRDAARAIREVLASDYDVQSLPNPGAEYKSLEAEVYKFLESRPPRSGDDREARNYLDKSKRDAALYAALVQGAEGLRRNGGESTMILVSSARRLARVEQKFTQLGERQLVVPPSAVLYLLSIIPEVTIGRNALRNFLFDPVRRRFSNKLEKVVLRAVREASHVVLPFGRRAPLLRKLREAVFENGASEEAIDKKLLAEPSLLADRVAKAITEVNADSPLARELRDVQAENERLRARLEEVLRTRRR